ncbi:MAG: DAK2 domain-containing protein [Lachnospiraceae bacterium]|nr:DAK2 domain-containing protein [Lachnospiraceae bacterium]
MNAEMVKKCFLAGAAGLNSRKEYINELNVFPVPDGDTGTNMTMTIMSAVKAVGALETFTMADICKAISSGSLRGARGNSGVILSQLLRGMTREMREYEEITVPVLAASFKRASDTAYKAVMKPKEGTILTVARAGAEKAAELVDTTDDLEVFLQQILEHMDEVLEQTPELLPVLKEAGVVDSGGTGLTTIMHSAFDALLGKVTVENVVEEAAPAGKKAKREAISTDDIKFGYCTEFIIMCNRPFTDEMHRDFQTYLESLGDSLVLVAMDDLVKVHVHTNDPGLAIQRALTYGELTSMKIDNMREEHRETLFEDEPAKEEKPAPMPHKEYGFISVAAGDGIGSIFRELGVDVLISGGQTMNPSTDDMLSAIDRVNADVIFILPNNKNIILAAEQAAKLTKDKKIIVIPTKTIPQGIEALINFVYDRTPEENTAGMTESLEMVQSGEVTYAVRDTSVEGKIIHQGDIMGIGDEGILAVTESVDETVLDMIEEMVNEDSEMITLYYGADVAESEAESLGEQLRSRYEEVDIEVEVHFGGQPIYYYIVSVE